MTDRSTDFIREIGFGDLPPEVVDQARLCILDLIGVAAAGRATHLAHIISDHCAENFAGHARTAGIFFDGRRVSPVGAALANGMIIDAFDAHDGHVLTKGHAGAAVVPAALALAEAAGGVTGRELVADIVVGYEVAIRAGIATHRTAGDYHTSGSWNALGAAAIGARRLGLDAQQTRQALGIAEYHGPRSPMMRCIDHPTMVKDGSGWGAMTGVSAALLAASGFTGAPADVVEGREVGDLWGDMGNRWRVAEIYFKPYPICRWAQPAVEAALGLVRTHELRSADIEGIEVFTFHEAARLATRSPRTTEQAQYSLPFPVAAAIVRRRLTAAEVQDSAFADPEIARLSAAVAVAERDDFNARFPAGRYAQVVLTLRNGRRLASPETSTRGDPQSPLDSEELRGKFRALVDAAAGAERRSMIEQAIATLTQIESAADHLIALVTSPRQELELRR